MIEYKKHHLARMITVQEINSADYVQGVLPSTHFHAHQDAWELCACLEGEMEVVSDQRKFTLSGGQLLLIHPAKSPAVSVYRENSSAFVVSFTCTNSGNLLPLVGGPLQADEQQTHFFLQMIQELDRAFRKQDNSLHLSQFAPADDSPFGAEHVLCCYLELVILSLLRNVTMDQGEIVSSSCFTDAINTYLTDQITQYIDNHLSEPLTVESIARHFHYSRARLSTLYKSMTGLGIKETIDKKRIQQAKLLLMQKEKSVLQISEELGFASSTYFTHKFTKTVGMSPTKYAALMSSSTKTS